jgi:imidazolonepropionase-like amidohydrolase
MTLSLARARGSLLAAAAFLLPAGAASAQFTAVPAPATYAIRNTTVVQPDGSRATGVNVIIRGSFIEAVGRNAAIPNGSQVIPGDSLFVYPGIIDAAGAVKYAFPKDSIDRTKVRSWDPPRALQGFMPARMVSRFLTPDEKELKDLRKKGVVAVAVHPTDMIMPGQGALLMLRSADGDPARMVIDPSLGAVMTLRPARGAYPSTGMGLMAFYRQTFLDAQRLAQISRTSSTDPRVLTPTFDADYAVVQQVLAGTMPIFFVANTADEIQTVFHLADEFKLKPTIIGGTEAWKMAGELKARNIPVLVSLNYPKPRQYKPEPEKKDSTKAEAPAEPTPTALREKKDLEDAWANPGRLAAAGVRFALTSGGEADIRAAMQKAIDAGLSEAAAIRAVTSSPAQILGMPATGRIEAGMPATFIVASKPLFEKDSKITWTFVEGDAEKGGEDAPAGRTATRNPQGGAQ